MANKRGRPRKMGLDWFPFDVTLLTDRKLRRPRAEFGSAAVLTYIALLSLIYRDKGYYLAYQGDGREDVALDVADLIGGALAPDALAQADQIQKIIGALVDRGLFDRACFEILEYTIGDLTAKGRAIHRDTLEARDWVFHKLAE